MPDQFNIISILQISDSLCDNQPFDFISPMMSLSLSLSLSHSSSPSARPRRDLSCLSLVNISSLLRPDQITEWLLKKFISRIIIFWWCYTTDKQLKNFDYLVIGFTFFFVERIIKFYSEGFLLEKWKLISTLHSESLLKLPLTTEATWRPHWLAGEGSSPVTSGLAEVPGTTETDCCSHLLLSPLLSVSPAQTDPNQLPPKHILYLNKLSFKRKICLVNLLSPLLPE